MPLSYQEIVQLVHVWCCLVLQVTAIARFLRSLSFGHFCLRAAL